jgi:hypothetical protein
VESCRAMFLAAKPVCNWLQETAEYRALRKKADLYEKMMDQRREKAAEKKASKEKAHFAKIQRKGRVSTSTVAKSRGSDDSDGSGDGGSSGKEESDDEIIAQVLEEDELGLIEEDEDGDEDDEVPDKVEVRDFRWSSPRQAKGYFVVRWNGSDKDETSGTRELLFDYPMESLLFIHDRYSHYKKCVAYIEKEARAIYKTRLISRRQVIPGFRTLSEYADEHKFPEAACAGRGIQSNPPFDDYATSKRKKVRKAGKKKRTRKAPVGGVDGGAEVAPVSPAREGEDESEDYEEVEEEEWPVVALCTEVPHNWECCYNGTWVKCGRLRNTRCFGTKVDGEVCNRLFVEHSREVLDKGAQFCPKMSSPAWRCTTCAGAMCGPCYNHYIQFVRGKSPPRQSIRIYPEK